MSLGNFTLTTGLERLRSLERYIYSVEEWIWKLLSYNSSFFSGNSAISVSDKGLSKVKMYVETIFFQKVKFYYKATN